MPESNSLLFQKQTSTGLVEVWQNNTQRRLTIDSVEQTCFDLSQPTQLISPVYHAFLACLIFIDSPQKILLAGTGGGALARYFHAINSDVRGDAVEISATVADVARQYFDFPSEQWSLSISDIQLWAGNNYDLILADIAENKLTPSWLLSEKMLSQFKYQLSNSGVLIVNLLVDDAGEFSHNLAKIRQVFDRKTVCLSVHNHKNVIVFAFNGLPPFHSIEVLSERVNSMTKLWQLNFQTLLEQLIKDNPEGSGVL